MAHTPEFLCKRQLQKELDKCMSPNRINLLSLIRKHEYMKSTSLHKGMKKNLEALYIKPHSIHS